MFLNTIPTLTAPDATNLSFGNPKTNGDAVFSFSCGANRFDLFRRQFGFASRITQGSALGLSAFGVPINGVVFVRSKEKMVNIHAGACVARMTNAHFVRDGAFYTLPRQAVRAPILSAPRKHAVATFCKPRSPQDAARGRRLRIVRKPFGNCPFAGDKRFSVRLHSLNCSTKAIVGQGRISRVNADRPAFYSTIRETNSIGGSR